MLVLLGILAGATALLHYEVGLSLPASIGTVILSWPTTVLLLWFFIGRKGYPEYIDLED